MMYVKRDVCQQVDKAATMMNARLNIGRQVGEAAERGPGVLKRDRRREADGARYPKRAVRRGAGPAHERAGDELMRSGPQAGSLWLRRDGGAGIEARPAAF